jgi:hypothetical protein
LDKGIVESILFVVINEGLIHGIIYCRHFSHIDLP